MAEVVTEPVSRQTAPSQQPSPQNPVNAIVEPVIQVIEPVIEVVEEPVGQVTRPAIEAVEPATDTVQNVVDSAAGAIDPVAEVIEEPVAHVTRPAIEALEPVTGAVQNVVDSTTGAIAEPVTRIVQTVSPALEEIQEPLEPVLGVVTTTVETATGLVDEVSTPILDGVDDLVDVTLPLVPLPDDPLGGVEDDPDRGPAFDPNPSVSGPPSNEPVTPIPRPDQGPSKSITNPQPPTVGSPLLPPLPAQPGIVDDGSRSLIAAASPTPIAPSFAVGARVAANDPESPPYDSESAGLRARTGVVAASSSSGSGSTSGLLAVLVLLGLIAPRLSRWLRPRPVLWRQFALAEALELPG